MNNKYLLPDICNNSKIPTDLQLLTTSLINQMLDKFWDEIRNKIGDKFIILLFRIQFIDWSYRTIGNLQNLIKTILISYYLY